MNREEILAKLKEIFIQINEELEGKKSEITEGSDLLRDLGFSSLNMIYMAVLIEETFAIRIDPEKDPNVNPVTGVKVNTVSEIMDMIERQLGCR